MSDQSAEFEVGEVLRAIGKVQLPEPRVLDNAREVLWSAIASEMLGIGPAGEKHHTITRRHQTGRAPGERRMSMGGGEPDS